MNFPQLDLDDAFESYMRKVNPTVAETSTQYRESRRVWFAAVAVIYYYLLSVTTLPEDDAIKLLAKIEKQLREFKTRVEKDRD